MEIKGLQKTSLIDFPGNICATLFIPGCNLRCPFCYNRDLVLHPDSLPTIHQHEVLDFLEKRSHLLDGICVSGGEPALHPGLKEFLGQVGLLGLKIKLDTNGTRPYVVQDLLESGLLDYVALDIKSPPEKYAYATGNRGNAEEVFKTASLLQESCVDHEFRTTVIPGLQREDLTRIAQMLEGASRYMLQPFRPGTLLDPSMNSMPVLTGEELQAAVSACREFVAEVKVRGE